MELSYGIHSAPPGGAGKPPGVAMLAGIKGDNGYTRHTHRDTHEAQPSGHRSRNPAQPRGCPHFQDRYRCRNGDHYWVFADVSVVRDQGKVTGDLSIRSVPTEAQIQQAEALYARLNAGKAARSGILAWLADRNLGLRRVSAERLTLVQAMALVPSLIWVKQGPCS